jgi:GNAT superfamily N-acetyltransferase
VKDLVSPEPVTDAVVQRWQTVYTIRTFRADDAEACRILYTDGLLDGQQLAANDTGIDIDDIEEAYLANPLDHFWVAEVSPEGESEAGEPAGTIVGMIGVQHHDEGIGEIRRLRVADAHRRRRIGTRLLETAIKFCRDTGSLKVALDTFIERSAAIKLFERNRFHHGRTRQLDGKDTLYFYLDFYSSHEQAPS